MRPRLGLVYGSSMRRRENGSSKQGSSEKAVSIMLLRILSGSSLYVLVLTAAVAAPLAPVGDGTRPPSPVIEARNSSVTNSDVTGSLGTGAPTASSAQLAMLKATSSRTSARC